MQQRRGLEILKNTTLGIVFKILTLILNLVSRYAFVIFLSDDLLGINGLYTNILSLLSMADFGVHAVMVYFLYEPLTQGEFSKIAEYLKLFRKVFLAIAGVLLSAGLLLLPILPTLVKGSGLPNTELREFYLYFLVNAILPYFCAHKTALLIADQKGYCTNFTLFVTNIVRIGGQIAVLYLFQSFHVYLAVMLAGTVCNNLLQSVLVKRMYPALVCDTAKIDVQSVKSILIDKTKAVFLYRMGGTLIDSTDTILISVLVGTTAVGFYSNYSMITMNIFALTGVLSQACMAGMGNFSIQASTNEKKSAFLALVTAYFFVGTVVLCGIAYVSNDFVLFWLKDAKYVLQQSFVFVLAVRLFLDVILSPNWVFREAQGLFAEAKMIRLWGALLNLILSIAMGWIWGLTGIIGATIVAKLLTTFWFEPWMIYKSVLFECVTNYWKRWGQLLLLSLSSVAVSGVMAKYLSVHIGNLGIKIIAKTAICIMVPTAFFAVKYMEWRKSRK